VAIRGSIAASSAMNLAEPARATRRRHRSRARLEHLLRSERAGRRGCVDLLDDLHAGLVDGFCPRRFKAWAAAGLLVIDDVGLGRSRSTATSRPPPSQPDRSPPRPRLDRRDLQHRAQRSGSRRHARRGADIELKASPDARPIARRDLLRLGAANPAGRTM
jgi:hypothetical protein